MTLPNLPEVPQKPTLEQLTQIVAEMSQQLTYLLSGFLSSDNAREFGGWQIGQTELQSKNKTVGMSTEVTGADDIRFWAGDVKTGTPKFKVTEAGLATLVSAVLASVASGERVVIDSTGLHCYDASNVERMTIGTTTAKGVKAISGRDTSGTVQSVTTYDTETVDGASRTGQYITAHGAYILIENNREIRMQTGGSTVDTGFRAQTLGRPEINDGGGWSPIAKQGVNTDAAGSHNHGISGGVQLATTSDGITIDGYVTWVTGGSHSHSQN